MRNACLDHAPSDCDFVAFVDDDEWVEPQWLAALLENQRATGAPIIQGPVRPSYLAIPPQWLAASGVYEVGPFGDGLHEQRDRLSTAPGRSAGRCQRQPRVRSGPGERISRTGLIGSGFFAPGSHAQKPCSWSAGLLDGLGRHSAPSSMSRFQ